MKSNLPIINTVYEKVSFTFLNFWLFYTACGNFAERHSFRIVSSESPKFIKTFEQLMAHLTSFKPHLLLTTGDFNARSSSLWSGDVDNIEDTRLKSITSFYGLHQIINEPTHVLLSSSSCIDLIFTKHDNR